LFNRVAVSTSLMIGLEAGKLSWVPCYFLNAD